VSVATHGSVRVRFFASLREAVGQAEVQIAVSTATLDLEALLARLGGVVDEQALARLRAPSVRIAVNQAFVEGNVTLRPGDEVAFLPPVTGG
jgi:sulfur-carrier protein